MDRIKAEIKVAGVQVPEWIAVKCVYCGNWSYKVPMKPCEHCRFHF